MSFHVSHSQTLTCSTLQLRGTAVVIVPPGTVPVFSSDVAFMCCGNPGDECGNLCMGDDSNEDDNKWSIMLVY